MTAANKNTEADFVASYSVLPSGCWEWRSRRTGNGYGLFSIGGERRRAHRFAYELANGPIPKGLAVCHSCDNRACVNPDHLWLGTQADNLADMSEKGRARKGPSVHSEAHPLSKLTKEQALAIRVDPRPARDIAPEYGVSKSLIWGIKNGTHWKYA